MSSLGQQLPIHDDEREAPHLAERISQHADAVAEGGGRLDADAGVLREALDQLTGRGERLDDQEMLTAQRGWRHDLEAGPVNRAELRREPERAAPAGLALDADLAAHQLHELL